MIQDKRKFIWSILVGLMLLQPVLDNVLYATAGSRFGVVPGLVRLMLLVSVVVYGMYTAKNKKRLFVLLALIGAFFSVHALWCYLDGYQSLIEDVKSYAVTMQLFVYTTIFYEHNREADVSWQEGLFRWIGMVSVVILTYIACTIGLAALTQSLDYTYEIERVGIKGWFIYGNEQGHILVLLSAFALTYATRHANWWVFLYTVGLTGVQMFFYGTRATYFGLIILCGALVVLSLLSRQASIRLFVLTAVAGITILLYRQSPMIMVQQATETAITQLEQQQRDATLRDTDRSFDSLFIKRAHKDPYREYFAPIIAEFGFERVTEVFPYTKSIGELVNSRRRKIIAAYLAWDSQSIGKKLFGMEQLDYTIQKDNFDVENDTYGILFSFGIVGAILYAGIVSYVLVRAAIFYVFGRSPLKVELGMMMVTIVLLYGLAAYAGHVVKRPNVNVYLAAAFTVALTTTLPIRQTIKDWKK